MPGLSRRQFIAAVGALAAASAIPREVLGPALAGQASPLGAGATPQHPLVSATAVDPAAAAAAAPSTLQQTILQGAVQKGSYRTLVTGPGEPYLPRLDVLGRAPEAGRVAARRSLLYLGHLSDMHVIDAQSPGRIEPMIVQDHSAWGSAFHPQDPLSPHVTASTVKSFSDLRYSPLTGAPMGAVIVTGDSADMHSHRELRWYIDLLDGLSVDPKTSDTFEGVQAWAEAVWAYRPGDPAGGSFGDYGFPTLPELLDQSIAQPVQSVGLPAPWYTVYGNHETLLLGTFGLDSQLRDLAVGGQKSYTLEGTASAAVAGYAAQTGAAQRALDALGLALGLRPGFKSVPADPSRALFSQREFMEQHFETEPDPGPVGHGFTEHNLASGETWWKADLSPTVRAFGLDTCNQVAGPDGAVPDNQFRWLRGELETATEENKLVLVLSHHNSDTLENRAHRPGQHELLHGAEVFVAMLLEFPVVVGWLNGHTHLNQILAHRAPGGGGFWEITTASCIDFPQQQQMVELVDNRDGTLSLFTTVVDHAADAVPGSSGSYLDLASRSRELASNDWAETPLMRRGSPLDRNTELLLPAPFDLEGITDAQLELQHMVERTRLLQHESRLAEAEGRS
ncbi:TIGR03767 family metallophosphoesterase [Herbiconiux sp. KACC 21604]|uniref:TIGR03767 family metallophosphoesterase n=1 Tax=unclassified Herbiconiux TaxID=2618217 RepID=UPI00149185AE|nr:TIGR03767 family metallophosphoesterase [Herbiconiux sp. SALV-R1]QJU54867.1 TIGR03767 family metallophosphoesterase [Herbiconiux sp. SALV-R1]WPO85989.1 TIGR03767 family metallophosphoesterase [Herbiconiux sp. KACC 21604]